MIKTKNLEKYAPGLCGYADITAAIKTVTKTDKHPDDLIEYNSTILSQVEGLCD